MYSNLWALPRLYRLVTDRELSFYIPEAVYPRDFIYPLLTDDWFQYKDFWSRNPNIAEGFIPPEITLPSLN